VGIEFKYPILALLFIPALFLIYLFLKQAKKIQDSWWLAGIRMAIFALIIFALMIPQMLLPVNGETVVFLVDRSASVENLDDAALEWIENSVSGKGADDQYAIAAFGENAALEQPITNGKNPITQFTSNISNSETSLEGGIQFASSLIPNNSSGRIVLMSDGNETLGEARAAAGLLKNRKIDLDYVLLKNDRREDLSIEELKVPSTLYEGEEAPVTITIDSNSEKQAVVRLSVNNLEILKETVHVKEGKNVYTFAHQARESGLSVYKAEIAAENDAFIENNILHSIVNVLGTPKVLIVQGADGGNLSSIIEDTGVEIETISPDKLPTALSSFIQYQSIVFNNVPATVVSENQMNMIEKAVKEFGTGFVMTGGDESFGLGGYFKTPIEKLLPVDMDIKGKKELPSLGLVIVMDRSGSMAGSKLELAKEAAARSVELLREEDTLGFIAFDDRPWVIVETAPLKDKKEAADNIRSVAPGGGTEIYSSLELAYQELEDLKLQRKHIILLTDGQAPGGDYEGLIESGKEKNITLSTVALGSDADRALLEDLAAMGTGRFYDVTDSSVIPSILSRETVMATRTYIEDSPFYPRIANDPDWSSFFSKGVPQINAYIAVTPKTRANVPILSEKDDPVLAEWQYGMGHTIAFTSDLSGKWSGDWARWNQWPNFINQLITKTLPQYESEPYRMSLRKEKGNPVLTLESIANKSLPMEAVLVSENGEEISTNTRLTAPGKYEISLPNRSGMFFLSVKQTGGDGSVRTYQSGFTIPYSDEYLLSGQNEELLKELSKMTGGKGQLSDEKDAFRPLSSRAYTKQLTSQWLLMAAFLLFFAEIAIRRFNLLSMFRSKMGPKLRKKSKEKTETRTIEKANSSKPKAAVPKKEVTQDQTETVKQTEENKDKKRKKTYKPKDTPITAEERAERMKRLLDAKKRKN